MSSCRSSAGYSLLELLTVLVLLGLLASLSAPSLRKVLERARVRSVLHRLSADLYRARALAARSGQDVVLRFVPSEGECARGWSLEDPDIGRTLLEVDLGEEAPGVCLSVSGSRAIRVNSRGMPTGAARKIRVRLGSEVDSLSISLVGRVYRWSFLAFPPSLRRAGNNCRSGRKFRVAGAVPITEFVGGTGFRAGHASFLDSRHAKPLPEPARRRTRAGRTGRRPDADLASRPGGRAVARDPSGRAGPR